MSCHLSVCIICDSVLFFPDHWRKGDNEIIYPDLLRTIIKKKLGIHKESEESTEQSRNTSLSQELSQV